MIYSTSQATSEQITDHLDMTTDGTNLKYSSLSQLNLEVIVLCEVCYLEASVVTSCSHYLIFGVGFLECYGRWQLINLLVNDITSRRKQS